MALAHGVIGNTTDFGSVILGSSPSGPTTKPRLPQTGFFILQRAIPYNQADAGRGCDARPAMRGRSGARFE